MSWQLSQSEYTNCFARRARPPLASSSQHNRASKESDLDVEPPPKRRRCNVLHGILEQRNEEDTERLDDARARADQHHSELLQAQNATLNCLKDLTCEIRGLREDNRAPRDTGESSRTTEILAELIAKKF